MYCYHVIINFCYEVSDSRKKKIVKIVIVQEFDWLNRYLVYYLYMDKCGCVGQ